MVSPDWLHRDVERVGLDDRVAVAELAGRLGVRGDPGQLLDQGGAHLADVVRRAAAEDLHPPDRPGLACVHVEPAEVGGAEPLVEAAAQHPLRGGRLLEHLLVHERLVLAGVVRRRVDVDASSRALPVAVEVAARYVVKPAAVSVASSPSSRCATVVVWRTIAARSEATYISFSPTPTISGLPLRADDDPVGEVGVQDGEAVGARRSTRERVADLALERVGVGPRRRGGRAPRCRCRWRARRRRRSSSLPQRRGVVDDAVVDDRDAARSRRCAGGRWRRSPGRGSPSGCGRCPSRAGEPLGQRRRPGRAPGRPAWRP